MQKDFIKEYKMTDRKFWENYWYYYKSLTLWSLFFVFIIAYAVGSCMRNITPDIPMMMITKTTTWSERMATLEEMLSLGIEDINSDGKKRVGINTVFMGEPSNPLAYSSALQKADVSFAVGDIYLFLVDQTAFDRYNEAGAFADLSGMLGKYPALREKIVYESGVPVAVDITSSKLAKSVEYTGDKLYLGMRIMLDSQKEDKKYLTLYEQSQMLLQRISTDGW